MGVLLKGSHGTQPKEIQPFITIFLHFSTLTSLGCTQTFLWIWKQIKWKMCSFLPLEEPNIFAKKLLIAKKNKVQTYFS